MTTSATQPSTLSVAIASGLFGLIIGYFLGQGSSIGVFDRSRAQSHKKRAPKSWPNSYDVKVHADSSDETEGDEDDEEDDTVIVKTLNGFEDSNEEVKLMLVVRTDLGMTKGKIAAQCSHATLGCYRTATSHPPSAAMLQRWENSGQPKIAVQVKSEEELLLVQAQALSLGLCARVIRDAGRTQIAAGSATVVGILGPKSVVDQVTGQLKLL